MREPASPRPVSFGHAIDSLADGLVILGRDGRCVFSNAAARRLLGGSPTEEPALAWADAAGRFRSDPVTPGPPSEPPFSRVLRGEVVTDIELYLAAGDATPGIWLSVNGAPIRDADGRIDGGVLLVRDVTSARNRSQRSELLSNVVETTADAVIVTDPAGLIEYVNPAFEETTGFSRAEALGRTPSILKSGAHPTEFYAGLWKALLDGTVFRGTFVNRKKTGEHFFTEQTITPIRDRAGKIVHVVSVGKDVTQTRRAAERESTLLLARSVQQRLFPASPTSVPGFDVFGAAFVADVTGGDYYDFIPLPGDRLAVLVADVSGHGVDSALLMAETRAVVRATAQTTAEPSEILSVVNRVLHADTEPHRFATLLLACLHVPTGALAYSSAGHPSGYVLDRFGRPRAELPATGRPLGLFAESTYETRSDLRLEAGEALVLMTDGVTDCGDPEGELFGIERALEVLRAGLSGSSAAVVGSLYRAVRAFEGGAPQRDDVTALVVKRRPAPAA
jgi:sigma-B regulation protein RsbU (phosphoserine phosphatase)